MIWFSVAEMLQKCHLSYTISVKDLEFGLSQRNLGSSWLEMAFGHQNVDLCLNIFTRLYFLKRVTTSYSPLFDSTVPNPKQVWVESTFISLDLKKKMPSLLIID